MTDFASRFRAADDTPRRVARRAVARMSATRLVVASATPRRRASRPRATNRRRRIRARASSIATRDDDDDDDARSRTRRRRRGDGAGRQSDREASARPDRADASARWRRLERDATTTLGTRDALSKRTLGADDGGYEWLRRACDDVAEDVVRGVIEGGGEWSREDGMVGFDLTAATTAAARRGGEAPNATCGAAIAHRATTNPMFLRAAFERLVRDGFDGDEARAKESAAWGWIRGAIAKRSSGGDRADAARAKRMAKTEDDGTADVAERAREATRVRVSAFVERGRELLAIERAREMEMAAETAVDREDVEDVDDESSGFVSEESSEFGAAVSGLRLVGATRGSDGKALVVLRAADGEAIAMNSLTVGDRVTISAYGDEFASANESADGSAATFSSEATVRFMGDALNATAKGRYGDASSISLEYADDEQALVRALSGLEICLSRAPDETTYERQARALDILESIPAVKRSKPACLRVVKTIFSEDRPAMWRDARDFYGGDGAGFAAVPTKSLKRVDAQSLATKTSFDESQVLALRAAASTNYPVVCIQGPPGTGKTSVVVEIIAQAAARGERVLACAPSNLAVDNLVERLDGVTDVRAVRFGAPERISAAALSCSLDAKVSEATELFFQTQRVESSETSTKLRALMDRYQKATNVPKKQREKLQSEIEALKKKLKTTVSAGTKHRKASQAKILREANVVLATNAGAGMDTVQQLPPFDLVVVDEAAQASEPLSWIPLVRGRRAVLIGDPCQLAPVVRSLEAVEAGLARSLMSRLMPAPENLDDEDDGWNARAYASSGVLTLTLSTQYRSHETISSWSSREAYGGRLRAAESVRGALLRDLPGVQDTQITRIPMLMITARSPYGRIPAECNERRVGGSYINEGEATTAAAHVLMMLKAGVRASDIAVISPYAAQVRLLRSVLAVALEDVEGADAVEISSIDSFQGREAECVIISTVRSNARRGVGFLSDNRRMNVAVTRGKRHVTIIGDDKTIMGDAFLRRLVEHIEANAAAVIPRVDLFAPVAAT